MSVGNASSLASILSEAFEGKAIQIILGGYMLMRNDPLVSPSWKETKFSSRLVGCMQTFKQSLRLEFNIIPEYYDYPDETLFGDGDPAKCPRIDLVVQQYGMAEKLYYGVETKRLRAHDRRLVGEYVRSGLKRFVSGKYAPRHPFGGMIGFVLNGTVETIVQDINQLINGDVALGPSQCLRSHQLVEHGPPDTYQSSHQRQDFVPIRITHVFCTFDFPVSSEEAV